MLDSQRTGVTAVAQIKGNIFATSKQEHFVFEMMC